MERLVCGDTLSLTEVHEPTHSPLLGGPGFDRAFAQGFQWIRNHQIHIDINDPAESTTVLAGPQGAVKGKEIGDRIIV